MKIPLILWGRNPPSHSITCIARCCNNSRIMTGSIEGQIGCWDVIYDQTHDTYSIQPFCIIFAHSCSMDDICLLSNIRMGIHSGLVSLSNSGELCLWNSENGCCLNTTQVNSKFNKIYAIYGKNADVRRQSLIICYGTYPEMQIFDPFSLEMLFTLKQNCPWPNFISTVCFFPASNNLMAVTYSGIIKTWDMCGAFQRSNKFSVIKDSNQYNLALQPDCIVRQILPNLTSNKHFLLVTAKQFFIYDSTKIIRLISTPVQLQQSWAGGDFLGNNMVIMWDKTGTCYLFAISNDECLTVFDSPLLYAIFHTDQRETGLSVTMLNHPRKNMNFSVIFQGCIGGRITFWRLPLLADLNKHVSLWCDQIHQMSEIFDEEGFGADYHKILDDHVVHMEATYVTGLSDAFNKSQPPNIINKIDNADKNPVCCSIFLTETGFIAAGRTNGNITLIPALQALCFEFLSKESTTFLDSDYEGGEYCNLSGHTKKITYLFYPYDENDHYQPHHLLSGSADFTVRLWNIITHTQLACFGYHAGVITKILPVPANSSSVIGSSIVTIGSDHTVNVINIDTGKHIVQANSNNSPVQIVKWRVDEDLMLLGCGDGVIYIWQLSTGKLDRCISGSVALEILKEFHDITDLNHNNSNSSSSSSNVNSTANLNEKHRLGEKKLSRVASTIAMKFGKHQNSNSKDQMHQLRFHRHHLHSNHHINLSSLKKNKLKRRSFKMKSFSSMHRLTHKSDRSLKDHNYESKILSSASNLPTPSGRGGGPMKSSISRSDSRTFDNKATTTTLNMASQPLTNLQSASTSGLNYSNAQLNDDHFFAAAHRTENSSIENVSHTTNQYLPFNIISARTSYHNDDIHVLLFDPNAIIRTINYLEETLKSIKNLRVGHLRKYPSSNVSADANQQQHPQSGVRPISSINLSVNYPFTHNASQESTDSDHNNNNNNNKPTTNSHTSSRMSSCFKYLGLAVAPPNNICDYSKYLTKHAYYQSKMIRETIKILISALSAWGLDRNLDKMCEEQLMLSYPQKSFCFGLISHGKLVAQLPLPRSTTPTTSVDNNSPTTTATATHSHNNTNGSNIQQSVVRHWNSSKTMLTQHIVTIVSIANAILGAESSFVMDYIFSSSNIDLLRSTTAQTHKTTTLATALQQSSISEQHEGSGVSTQICMNNNSSLKQPTNTNLASAAVAIGEKSRFFKKTISSDSNDLITTIKNCWSNVANFYCFSINSRSFACKQFHFRGVILHELIRHWLSFNSNIREASRSILLSELTRLGVDYVSSLILAWSYFLPDNISFYDNMYTSGTSDQIPVSYPGIQNSLVIESGGSYGYWPTPMHHRATLALYMICFIVSELYIPRTNSMFNLQALSDVLPQSKLQTITRLLMESITLGPTQKVHYPTPSKRSSIWLIGRGFELFGQYIDLARLIATLLDIVVTSEIIMKYHSSKQPRASKIEYTKAFDMWSTTQETLNTIAAHNPIKLLNSVEADIIRNVSNSNLLSNISVSSTTALHMYNVYVNNHNRKLPFSSHPLHHPNDSANNYYLNDFSSSSSSPASSAETTTLNILNVGAIFKKQLFQMMNHLFEVCYSEIRPYLIEIFDIVLQCLSPRVFKDKSTELYQRSKMFSCPMVNYNEAMKKLAVGTTQGKIGLYDVRSLKLSVFPAHESEISFLSFSPDGKYLVSFSKVDCNLKTWQSQFSIIGLINNPFKQHNSYLIIHPEGTNKLLECVPSFEWSDARHITVHIDQNKYSFVV